MIHNSSIGFQCVVAQIEAYSNATGNSALMPRIKKQHFWCPKLVDLDVSGSRSTMKSDAIIKENTGTPLILGLSGRDKLGYLVVQDKNKKGIQFCSLNLPIWNWGQMSIWGIIQTIVSYLTSSDSRYIFNCVTQINFRCSNSSNFKAL